MGTKLLIVNNGLRDLRGHYFETGVSVAEAAAAAGLETYVFAHAECDPEVLDTAPDLIPLCRTDHWMSRPPVDGPPMRGIRCDRNRVGSARMDDVLAGRAGIRDYLLARFEAPPVPPPETHRGLRGYLPPVALAAIRAGRRSVRLTVRAIKSFGRRLVPPAFQPRARSAWRSLRQLVRGVPPTPPPPKDTLQTRLARAGKRKEFDYVRVFQEDLERAISLTGAGPGDHVFLPTAHGRELAAVRRLVEEVGADHVPTFHLEFRHALDAENIDPINPHEADWLYVYTALHRTYFDWCRRLPLTPRVRVYTDTNELSEAYAHFSGLPFETLPIPFRTERIVVRDRRPDEPICLAYLGDARDEKGFAWLPALVKLLRPEAEAGRVRFLFQASLVDRRGNPQCALALRALRKMAAPYLELPGLDGPLGPDEYFELVSAADVILCPYSPETYQRRSSGTLTEGIAAGVPTVVPAGTWLERQQPPGTGTSFTDMPTFLAAARKVVAAYPRFAARARAHRDEWRAVHSPANLVRTLIHPPTPAAAA
jgi:hypothetical protein